MEAKIRTRYHYKNQRRDMEAILEIYRNARDYYWSQATINGKLAVIFNSDRFKTQPIHAKEYLRGVANACFEMHWQYLVYSYCIDGVRMAIDSPEYRQVSPQEVHEKWSDTGAYVYRNAINALYS